MAGPRNEPPAPQPTDDEVAAAAAAKAQADEAAAAEKAAAAEVAAAERAAAEAEAAEAARELTVQEFVVDAAHAVPLSGLLASDPALLTATKTSAEWTELLKKYLSEPPPADRPTATEAA